MTGMIYIDTHGKHWSFLAAVRENSEEFRQLRERHCLTIHNVGTHKINLDCKVQRRKPVAQHPQIVNCTFRGLVLRQTGRLYVSGDHNHPIGSNETTMPPDPQHGMFFEAIRKNF